MDLVSTPDVDDLVDHLHRRAAISGARQMIGIVGAPGTGKSTFATHLAQRLGNGSCVVVPMDGFHLASNIIEGTPLEHWRGAIDTFDVGGYLSLLERLKSRREPVVYAPCYRRGLEDPIAASISVPRTASFIITEGNYLLADTQPWHRVREYLDEIWFVETPREIRINRLIDRHVTFGKDPAAAFAWAHGPDEVNARYVDSTKHRADRFIDWV